jgi:hypothetical protein
LKDKNQNLKFFVLIGDTNVALSPKDKSNLNFKNRDDARVLNFLLNSYGLYDAADITGNSDFTCNIKAKNVQTRIDKAFVSLDMTKNIKFRTHSLPEVYDHKVIILELNYIKKFSNRFIFYECEINENMENFIKHNLVSNINKSWVQVKNIIFGKIKSLIIEKRKENKLMMEKIQEELNNSFGDNEKHKMLSEKLVQLKNEQKAKLTEKFRACFDTETVFPTKFLSNMLKRRSMENEIVLNYNGKVTSDTHIVSKLLSDYQKNIYSPVDMENSLLNKYLKNIETKSELLKQIDHPITLDEVKYTISKLKNSSPGPDGIPAFFYKKYKDLVAPYLFEQFKSALNDSLLPAGMREAAIRYIKKPNTDSTIPKSWRPISLINCDSKLLSSIFAIRIQSVISQLLPDQKAYIRGRNILDNIYSLEHLLQFNGNSLSFFSDISAAFDTVNHEWIKHVLDAFGFGNYMKNGIMTMLKLLVAYPIVDNSIQYDFKIQIKRGIRQGDPCSGLIFIIALEPLIKYILANYNKTIILSYADDLVTYTNNSKNIKPIIKEFIEFYKVSGLKLNIGKSHIFKNYNYPKREIENVPVSSEKFKYLGYEFNKIGTVFEDNAILKKLENTFSCYKRFKLSWLQKATVVNVFVFPKLFYNLYGSTPKPDFFIKVNNLTKWFFSNEQTVYDKKKTYVLTMNLDRLCRKVEDGGINLVHIEAKYLAIKLQMFHKLIKKELPYSEKIIEMLSDYERKLNKSSSPIFHLKKDNEILPQIIIDILPLIRKGKWSTQIDNITTTMTSNLEASTIYINNKMLNSSLKNCYKIAIEILSKPLYTRTQILWINEYGIDINYCWKTISKVKCRPALKSFLIKLWNNAIYFPDRCLCKTHLNYTYSLFHIFTKCDYVSNLFSKVNFPNLIKRKEFLLKPTKPSILSIGIPLYSFYKCLMKLHFEEIPITETILEKTYKEEIKRHRTAFKIENT